MHFLGFILFGSVVLSGIDLRRSVSAVSRSFFYATTMARDVTDMDCYAVRATSAGFESRKTGCAVLCGKYSSCESFCVENNSCMVCTTDVSAIAEIDVDASGSGAVSPNSTQSIWMKQGMVTASVIDSSDEYVGISNADVG